MVRTMSSNRTMPYVAKRIMTSVSLAERYIAAFVMRCLNEQSCLRWVASALSSSCSGIIHVVPSVYVPFVLKARSTSVRETR